MKKIGSEEEMLHHHHGDECDDPDCECHHHHYHEDECDDPDCECHDHHHGDGRDDPDCECYHHEDECDESDCECHRQNTVRISTHDKAIVGSISCCVPLSYNDAVTVVREKLQSVGRQVQEQGGFIGHVKGIVEGSCPQCRISITDEEEADVQMFEAMPYSRTECVCIVFGISKTELKRMISIAFAEWLEG